MTGDRVPAPTRLPALITAPMARLYALGIGHKNKGYDRGKGVTTLDRPVISVGNLSTGGTGKTPMVHLVVSMLQELGHHPAIAMRGYGAAPGTRGDEQMEHEAAMPGVPVVAQPDRIAGLDALFATPEGRAVDCVVLDDGFQHRRIARDLDIVLIDASRPPDRDALLPRGHLREPAASLSRASLIVLTHCERVSEGEPERLRAMIRRHAPSVPVLGASHAWSAIESRTRTTTGWGHEVIDPDGLRGQAVRVVSGIGNSAAFLDMARAHGMDPVQVVGLKDHEPVSSQLIRRLIDPANPHAFAPILMTRKDWVKTHADPGWAQLARVCVPQLRMSILDDTPLRDALRACVGARG